MESNLLELWVIVDHLSFFILIIIASRLASLDEKMPRPGVASEELSWLVKTQNRCCAFYILGLSLLINVKTNCLQLSTFCLVNPNKEPPYFVPSPQKWFHQAIQMSTCYSEYPLGQVGSKNHINGLPCIPHMVVTFCHLRYQPS